MAHAYYSSRVFWDTRETLTCRSRKGVAEKKTRAGFLLVTNQQKPYQPIYFYWKGVLSPYIKIPVVVFLILRWRCEIRTRWNCLLHKKLLLTFLYQTIYKKQAAFFPRDAPGRLLWIIVYFKTLVGIEERPIQFLMFMLPNVNMAFFHKRRWFFVETNKRKMCVDVCLD